MRKRRSRVVTRGGADEEQEQRVMEDWEEEGERRGAGAEEK